MSEVAHAMPLAQRLAAAGLVISLVAGTEVIAIDSAQASCSGTRCDAPGSVELAGSDWLGGSGVNIYSNGDSAENVKGVNCVIQSGALGGNGCDPGTVYSGEKWQCVELVNRLYLTKGWISSHWFGDGDQVYYNSPSNLAKQLDGHITSIAPGDVISLGDTTTGTANDDGGHAAIVDYVSGNAVTIVNQNTPDVLSSATLQNGFLTMNGWKTYHVIGVVDAPNSASDGSPSSSPLPAYGPAIAINQASGLATEVALGPSNSLYADWQNTVNGQWSGPLGIDGGVSGIAYSKPAVAINPQTGLATAVAQGPDHSLYVYSQEGIDGPWSGPIGIDNGAPGIAYSDPSIAINPNTGLATVVAEGPSNSLYAYYQDSQDGPWTGPIGIDGGAAGIAFSAPSIAFNNLTGLATAVAEGPNNSLYAYWQDSIDGQWSGPLGIDNGRGGIAYSAPSIAMNQRTGEATGVVEGPNGSLYAYWQDAIDGPWSGPLGIAGGASGVAYSAPSIAMNQTTGMATVVAEGPGNSLRAYWQNAVDGPWSGPLGIDSGDPGVAYSDPAVAINNSTELVTATAEGPNNSLYAYWQDSQNGPWSGPLGIDNGEGGIGY